VDDFIAEYAAGRTPNPCMRCNERIKFAALLDRALALGFDAIATGHYAEVVRDDDGRPELHRGEDLAKDQSYVLGVLTSDQLEHCYSRSVPPLRRPKCAPRRPSAGSPWPASPTPMTSASSPMGTRRPGWPIRFPCARDSSRTPRARCSASTMGR